ncbi:MAG: hypothetical protein ACOWWO_12720 [Peptococcaceae bacterium]
MKKRKSLLVVLLIVSFILVAGCSQAELGFWKTYGKIATMNKSLLTGEAYVSFNMSGQAVPAEYEKAMDLLEDLSIKYELRSSQQPEKLNLDLAYKTGHLDYKHLTNVRLVDNYFYLEIQPLMGFLKEYLPGLAGDLTQAEMLFQDVEYIKIRVPQEQQYELNNPQQINTVINNFTKNLKSIFAGYQTDLVTKDGHNYVLEVNLDSLLKTVKDLADYTLENSDQILSAVYYNLDDLDEETLALMLNVPPEEVNKAEIKAALQQFRNDFASHKASYQEQIEAVYQMREVIKENIERYEARIELFDKSDGKIGVKETVNLDLKDSSGFRVGLFALQNTDVKEVDDVIVTAPQGKVLDLAVFENMDHQ